MLDFQLCRSSWGWGRSIYTELAGSSIPSSQNFAAEILQAYRAPPSPTHPQVMVQATMGVYKAAVSTFLPTPSKSHYVFNLRDFSRVVRGVLLVPKTHMNEGDKLTRLWVHEIYRVFYDRLIDDKDRCVSVCVRACMCVCVYGPPSKQYAVIIFMSVHEATWMPSAES